MKFYIGIDSGGTKTKFTLADSEGEIIASALSGTTHYQQCGFDGVVSSLNMGIEDLLVQTKLQLPDIAQVFIGLAAYGEIKADMPKIATCVEQGVYNLPHSVEGDNVCGWGGSLGGKSGVNIVAGTGSIAYARNRYMQSARCGGWGHWFGGDEGSAFWIANRVLLAFSRQSDGRAPKTALYDYLKANYHFEDDFDILHLVVNKWNMDRSKVATLSRVASELAVLGDKAALAIFEEAGRQLAELVNTCVAAISFDEPIYASYSGGVFKSKELILKPFATHLRSDIQLVAPMFEPSVGGVIVAMLNDGQIITEDIVANLKRSSKK